MARLRAIAANASGPNDTGRECLTTSTTSDWVSGWIPICNGLVTASLDDAHTVPATERSTNLSGIPDR